MLERLLIATTVLVAGVALMIAAARYLSDDEVRRQRNLPGPWVSKLMFALPPPLARFALATCGLLIASLGVWLMTDLDSGS